jgi:hypothetical protein
LCSFLVLYSPFHFSYFSLTFLLSSHFSSYRLILFSGSFLLLSHPSHSSYFSLPSLLYFPPIFSYHRPYSLFPFIPSRLFSLSLLLLQPSFSTFFKFFPLCCFILFSCSFLLLYHLFHYSYFSLPSLLYFPPISPLFGLTLFSCSFLLLSHPFHSSYFSSPSLLSSQFSSRRPYSLFVFIPSPLSFLSFLSLFPFSLRSFSSFTSYLLLFYSIVLFITVFLF